MRNFPATSGPLAAALAVALLSAGCDRLQWPATTTHDEVSRYVITKDTRGRRVRLDKQTGEVTTIDGTKTLSPAKERTARTATVAVAASARRPARTAGTARSARAASQPPVRPTSASSRAAESKTAAVALPSAPTRIAFDELCGAPGERVAVTLVDTGVYARPSLGTPLLARVVSGALVTTAGDSGEWLQVNLEGPKGPVSGFVYCTALRPLTPGGTPDSDPDPPAEP